jgi:hypothetical protein
MARMYYSYKDINYGFSLTTIFEDDSFVIRKFKIGDTVEGLRYVFGDEIRFATGIIKDIAFTMNEDLILDLEDPTDVLEKDMRLSSIVVGTDTRDVIIPLREVVEFDGEFNVKRMKYAPFIQADLTMKFTDYRIEQSSIEVGDSFNKVKIIDPNDVPNPITGKFKVASFAYTSNGPNDLNVYGVAFRNVDTDEVVVADFENIHNLNEVYTYEITDQTNIASVVNGLADGDSITIPVAVNTVGNKMVLNQQDINLTIGNEVTVDGTSNSGIWITGKVTVDGEGTVVNNGPYTGAASGMGTIRVQGDGDLTINKTNMVAVLDDPVNKGQFGIVTHDNAKLTVNDGDFKAGWYCIAGNGSGTTANAVTIINGGKFVSVADYAIYHPHPGKLVINGGEIYGAAGAIAINNGSLEINGGTFDVLGDGDTGNWPDGTSGLGEACLNLNARYGTVNVVINDGKFKVSASNATAKMIVVNNTKNPVNITINGGLFTVRPDDAWLGEGKYVATVVDATDGQTYWKVQ